MLNEDYERALGDARLAARVYAKDPSDTNAERVKIAWQTVRRLKAVSVWRQKSETPCSANRDES